MFTIVSRRRAVATLALPLLAACGGATQNQASPATSGTGAAVAQGAQPAATTAPSAAVAPATAVPAPAAVAPASAPAQAGALVFQLTPGQSKAIFRVREQLAGRSLPNDAVGTTSAVTGQLAIRPDSTIAPETSKITVDINSLATDSNMRDQFIKSNTLQTRQYPTAEFVVTKIEGLAAPLPASGEHTFKLGGMMTLRGVKKELTWDVTAKRDGANLTGIATTQFKFGDFGMTPPKAASVLSVVDEIRLEVSLVASQAA